MSDSPNWGLHLGRWFHVQVRVHATFVAVAVFAVFLGSAYREDGAAFGLLAFGILFASVLAHELGHAAAAARLGGNGERVLLWPLGGFQAPEVPREPQPELIATLAGPAVNLALVLATAPLLVAAELNVLALLNPLAPTQLLSGTWSEVATKLLFWCNWVLLVANLLPAFPFDGGRILRVLLWPALDYRLAGLVTVRISKLVALGLCLLAWVSRDWETAAAIPVWVPVLLVASIVFFNAQHEGARLESADWDEDLLSYDFSQGYTSLERPETPRRPALTVRRWLESRRELRRRRQQVQELEEERQVDGILMRLHEQGLESLSPKERALLDRVSARFRNRQQN